MKKRVMSSEMSSESDLITYKNVIDEAIAVSVTKNRNLLLEPAYRALNSMMNIVSINIIESIITEINTRSPALQQEIFLLKAFLEFIQESKSTITPTPTEKRDVLVGRDPLLLWACDKKMTNMALALLTAGANPNVADVNGDTPLLVACDRSLVIVAIQLINMGAIMNATNNLKMSPMSICSTKNLKLITKTLTEKGAVAAEKKHKSKRMVHFALGGGRRLRLKRAAE